MGTWEIVLIVYCVISIAFFLAMLVGLIQSKEKLTKDNITVLVASLFPIPLLIIICVVFLYMELPDIWDRIRADGGIIKHYKLNKQRKKEDEELRIQREAEEKEYERIKSAYQNGELTEDELPRVEDAVNKFEFRKEMGFYIDTSILSTDVISWDLIYVENEYCESLNKFFINH